MRHSEEQDKLVFAGEVLIRIYNVPRTKLFNFKECDPPIPIDFLDIERVAQTDILEESESRIEDFWVPEYYEQGVETAALSVP